ncbi:aminotransferase class V-fold PLP-dependent enzyme [Aliishimia ponticola]|uniref:Aminotransferase class V-fold PLP-dependent enzyme n=1 Tax=Aliishimia ponticola TaxID=2499833 RepID=A0A4S4NCU1_9RHOB|nr:aminotransferase class V-fold PLP-dependent enzyme [Aliishimia ponticola]THH37274.1 aminotransferase class V-fold PLP-dependent enzyme [Aliishimia ponticola]
MLAEIPGLLDTIRSRFAHVDSCPFDGPRVFFENAGGALTLNKVVETSAKFAAIPDNQGRDNPASAALMDIIAKSKEDTMTFFGASSGQVFVGESGTELLFRLLRTAIMNAGGGEVLGSTVEHPASRSACAKWAERAGLPYIQVPHDAELGLVTPDAYRAHVTPQTRVATILHTSPVSGMGQDVAGIAAAIRAVAPDCLIIVDGIQHACHGGIDIDSYDIDGYVISPYKVFSRHGYGIAWVSDRFGAQPHDSLVGGPALGWEFGTRDTGSYATFSDVVDYFDWLGGEVSQETDRRRRIEAAGEAIHAHEHALTQAMLYGTGNQKGLIEMPGVSVLGGAENAAREGLVSVVVDHVPGPEVVAQLRDAGIRTHLRKADHYSGNILDPLGLKDCTRVSLAHYNTLGEVAAFLAAMSEICEK